MQIEAALSESVINDACYGQECPAGFDMPEYTCRQKNSCTREEVWDCSAGGGGVAQRLTPLPTSELPPHVGDGGSNPSLGNKC